MGILTISTNSGLRHRLTPDERRWVAGFIDQRAALLCIRYALMLNTRTFDWLEGCLDARSVYTTSIIDDFAVRGSAALRQFFIGRITTLTKFADAKPLKVMLARSLQNNSPCCLHYQRDGRYDRGIGRLQYASEISAAGDGLVGVIDTTMAEPDEYEVSGLFPGVSARDMKAALVQPPAKLPAGMPLLFTFKVLSGDTAWQHQGEQVHRLTSRLCTRPEYRLDELSPPREDARRWLYLRNIHSLPQLEVQCRGTVVIRLEGEDIAARLEAYLKGMLIPDTRRRVARGTASCLLREPGEGMGPAQAAAELFYHDRRVLAELLEALHGSELHTARRAAYALDRLTAQDWRIMQPHLEQLLGITPDERMNPVLRHIARMLPRFRYTAEQRFRAEKLLLTLSLHHDPPLRIIALRSMDGFLVTNHRLREYAGPFVFNLLCKSRDPRVVREAERSLDLIETLEYRDEQRWERPAGHA